MQRRTTSGAVAARGSKRRAISLIDLVVAVLIMGIVAAVGGVRYVSSLQVYNLRQAAQRIAGDIESARHMARNRRQVVTIAFNTTTGSYTVSGATDPDHPASPAVVRLQDIASSTTMAGANFGGGGATLRFNEYGNPDNGGTVVVSSGSGTLTVSVAAGTGSVSVP